MVDWRIEERSLSDGSKVYEIVGVSRDIRVVIQAVNLTHAVELLEDLEAADVEIERKVGV